MPKEPRSGPALWSLILPSQALKNFGLAHDSNPRPPASQAPSPGKETRINL